MASTTKLTKARAADIKLGAALYRVELARKMLAKAKGKEREYWLRELRKAERAAKAQAKKSGKRWIRIGPCDQYITKSQFKGLDAGELADLPTLIKKIYDYDYKEGE